jgi:hypothetical protein
MTLGGSALLVLAAILIGAGVVAWLDRWRKRTEAPPMSANEQLALFRELYERGELDAEEFARIRNRLGDRLRQELDVPTLTPVEPEPPAPPSAPPAAGPNNGQAG